MAWAEYRNRDWFNMFFDVQVRKWAKKLLQLND